MRLGWLIIFAACHEPVDTSDAEPTPNPCGDVQHTATFVDSTVFGPATGTSVTVPITPTMGGELLVVTVATTTGMIGLVRMIGGQSVFQVATGLETCGKTAVIASVGNIEPGVSSFTVETSHPQSDPPTTFAVFAMKFAGLSPETGARLSDEFGFGNHAVAACPGTVIVSTATSCGYVSLSPESPFTALDSIDGMTAAYHIPSVHGEYRADWRATDTMASAIVQLE